MSSQRAKTKTTRKHPQCTTSNRFAMFDQSQIQESKEAFNMIGQNRDGFIDKEDLPAVLASLGRIPLTDPWIPMGELRAGQAGGQCAVENNEGDGRADGHVNLGSSFFFFFKRE
uniref:EF-hand domain-containing protein n=1 Tax=Spermophilus dauricus TaxID=99837 RepID=A0A8C9PP34_SPEDA